MRIENPPGGYSFLKGISPYSGGVAALPGFEIINVRLDRALPLDRGFTAIENYLESQHRPRQALCAVELRSPHPFTFQGFQNFNQRYVSILNRWRLLGLFSLENPEVEDDAIIIVNRYSRFLKIRFG